MSLAAIDTLLDALDFERGFDLPTENVSALVKLGGTLTSRSQDRTAALMQSERLRDWVTSSTSSSMLHINGHMYLEGGYGEERRSPLSFVCAKLADALTLQAKAEQQQGRMNIFVVRWFCGEHTERTDCDAHPSGMMNSLISQLLMQFRIHIQSGLTTDLNITSLLPSDIQNKSVEDLCQTFSNLVGLLPPSTILFCIADGIAYYEDLRRREDLITMMRSLIELISYGETRGCIVKLLTTAPLRLFSVQQKFFTKDDVLDMDEFVPETGGFTSSQWNAKLGQHVDRIIG